MANTRPNGRGQAGVEDPVLSRAIRRRAVVQLTKNLTRQDAIVLMVALGLSVVSIAVGEQLGGIWHSVACGAGTFVAVGLVWRHFQRRLRDEVSLVLEADKAGAEKEENTGLH